MLSPDPRRRRCLVPMLAALEPRRLLSFYVTSDGQSPQVDYTGPDASQGPDGIVDLHLSVWNLSFPYTDIAYIDVQSPGGFQWQTDPEPGGYALAEFFGNTAANHNGDLYLSPEIKSDLPPGPGSLLPLGGSTGSLIGLTNQSTGVTNPNNVALTVTVYYSGVTTVDSYVLTGLGSNWVSPTDPMPATTTPNPVNKTELTILDDGQSSSTGLVHLYVTAPSGTFNNSDFGAEADSTSGGLDFELSDQAGFWWDSSTSTVDHNHIEALFDTTGSVDLYFAPVRDELAPSGSNPSTMTLQLILPNGSPTTVYATPFAGQGGT
jgi:hypothetical protein